VNRWENLRRHYRPEQVRVLFVGESRPASGRFFYRKDSGLYRAMRDAFGSDDQHFLEALRDAGCYLVDLCSQPVDDLEPKARRAECIAAEPSLTRRIGQSQPEIIVTLLRSIEANVARAVGQAVWQGEIVNLPYPGRWVRHREIFTRTLQPIVRMNFIRPGV
jgi:hypothetical protein